MKSSSSSHCNLLLSIMPTLTVVYYVCDISNNNNICGGDYLSLLFLAHTESDKYSQLRYGLGMVANKDQFSSRVNQGLNEDLRKN